MIEQYCDYIWAGCGDLTLCVCIGKFLVNMKPQAWLCFLVLDSVAISNGAPTAELELEVTDHAISYFHF